MVCRIRIEVTDNCDLLIFKFKQYKDVNITNFVFYGKTLLDGLRGAHTEGQRQRHFEVLRLGLERHNAFQWDLAAAAAAWRSVCLYPWHENTFTKNALMKNIMESDRNLPGLRNPVADAAIEQGGKKHEIYAAAFGSHLFMTYFHKAWEPLLPPRPAPWIRYWNQT